MKRGQGSDKREAYCGWQKAKSQVALQMQKGQTDNFCWKVWWRWVHLMNGLAEGRLAIDDDIHQR